MAGVLCLLLLIPLTAMMGIGLVQWLDQLRRDRGRHSYILTFPHDLETTAVVEWLWSLSGNRGSKWRLAGVHTLAFELWATKDGLTHRLKIPWEQLETVLPQLQGLVPGVKVAPDYEPPRRTWTRAVELGLTNPGRPLSIDSPERLATSLLKSVDHLEDGETVVMQWVVTPAPRQHRPIHRESKSDMVSPRFLTHGNLANKDEITERRDKLDQPNMLAVLRIGAEASTKVRANYLIDGVRRTLGSVHSAATRFKPRLVLPSDVQRSIDRAGGVANFPMQVSLTELAACLAWPIGSPTGVTGLPRPHGRQFPPHGAIPSQGLVVGDAAWPGRERPIAIGYNEANMHTHVLGANGTGKSVLLAHIARQAMNS